MRVEKSSAPKISNWHGSRFPICRFCCTRRQGNNRQDHVKALGIETALAVPVYYEGKLLGALMALNRTDSSLFDKKAERVLADYAKEVAPLVHQYQVALN